MKHIALIMVATAACALAACDTNDDGSVPSNNVVINDFDDVRPVNEVRAECRDHNHPCQ